MIISSKLTDDELISKIHLAAQEYGDLIGKSFLIIGKNKKSPYFWFECCFEKKHFMHLLGIKSKTMSADQFYDKCMDYNNGVGTGIKIEDCTPSRNHSRTTINEKSSCCGEMFHLEDAKYMKIGLKDKISLYVDFTYAYGSDAILGFQKDDMESSFPVTLIPRSIDAFSTQKYKIMYVFSKLISEPFFKKLHFKIKDGIFDESYSEMPDCLKKKIVYKEM